jgi:serine O-acetyltransferase
LSTITDIRKRHPRFRTAVLADAKVTAALRGERHAFRSRLDACGQIARLAWVSDAFLGQVFYRAKAGLQRIGIPVLPRIFQRFAIAVAGIYIGDPVIMHPGVYIVHGQVVIDGICEVHENVVISPAVTVGLRGAWYGPTIGPGVSLGTGSRVLGRVTVGARASVGANAVVIEDVPAGASAVGVPARIIAPEPPT